jgi:Cu2+-exporting ATPase
MRQESIIAPCIAKWVYDKADCPVCGMDLVKAPDLIPRKQCTLCIEIIQEGPGSCPIWLFTYGASESEDNKTYLDLVRK